MASRPTTRPQSQRVHHTYSVNTPTTPTVSTRPPHLQCQHAHHTYSVNTPTTPTVPARPPHAHRLNTPTLNAPTTDTTLNNKGRTVYVRQRRRLDSHSTDFRTDQNNEDVITCVR
ncbi:uncharacterized protein [Procambarus clarkii]